MEPSHQSRSGGKFPGKHKTNNNNQSTSVTSFPNLNESAIQDTVQIITWVERFTGASSRIHEAVRASLEVKSYDPLNKLLRAYPTPVSDPREARAEAQAQMNEYLAKLKIHKYKHGQTSPTIDTSTITFLANAKKEEIATYMSDNGIEWDHYGYSADGRAVPTKAEDIKTAILEIVLQNMQHSSTPPMFSLPEPDPIPIISAEDIQRYEMYKMKVQSIHAYNIATETQITTLKNATFNALLDCCPKALRKELIAQRDHSTEKGDGNFLGLLQRIIVLATRGLGTSVQSEATIIQQKKQAYAKFNATKQTEGQKWEVFLENITTLRDTVNNLVPKTISDTEFFVSIADGLDSKLFSNDFKRQLWSNISNNTISTIDQLSAAINQYIAASTAMNQLNISAKTGGISNAKQDHSKGEVQSRPELQKNKPNNEQKAVNTTTAPKVPAPTAQSDGTKKLNTKICKHFNRGNCKKGDECTFRHENKPTVTSTTNSVTSTVLQQQPSSLHRACPFCGSDCNYACSTHLGYQNLTAQTTNPIYWAQQAPAPYSTSYPSDDQIHSNSSAINRAMDHQDDA